MLNQCSVGRVLLVPGLLEPRAALWPLKRTLAKRCPRTEIITDRLAFRDLDRSVDRLVNLICDGPSDQPIAIVTHSFGDWIARRAISQSQEHHVSALVSLAPVMKSGLMTSALYLLSGNVVPEIRIISDRDKAAENLDCDDQVRRLVVWAKLDGCLRAVALDHVPNVQVCHVAATHLSIVLQPNVHRMVERFLFPRDPQSES